jgi:hypothetical protein
MDEISLDGVYYILRLHEFSMDILPFHEDWFKSTSFIKMDTKKTWNLNSFKVAHNMMRKQFEAEF